MYDKSWGPLGKPPKSVMDGSSKKMDLYRWYRRELEKAMKLAGKRRAVAVAEIRVRYLRDFPQE